MLFVLVFVCFIVKLTNLEHLFLINCQSWVIIDNPSTFTPDYFGKKDINLKLMLKEKFLIFYD